MNDGKIIIDKIMPDAESEVDAILARGRQEVETMQKAAEVKALRLQESYRKKAEEEARKAHAKEVSGAEMAAKKALLEEKQKILAEVIAEAKERLEQLPDVQYAEVIGGMLERLDPEQGKEIIVAQKDKARLADVIREKGYVLSEETRNIESGFVVKNGDVEYNYSFEAIIMVQKEEMQITAAKILF